MVQGEGSRDQAETRLMAARDPEGFSAIVERIVEVTIDYLAGQIEAGAEAVQLFDSWAGSLSPSQFERWVVAPNSAIVAGLKERHPNVPIIGFPKGAGGKLGAYAHETGVDAVGLDETVDPVWAAKELPAGMPVQGNFDPLLLLAGGNGIEDEARRILDAFAGRPHVFNLGHGIDKDTPVANVERLLAAVRGWRG
jgi:uroporphyrinogen decarboxylase